ncbi:MAG: hypothetical protein R3A46_02480 [Thermomicrobiales bacterium]
MAAARDAWDRALEWGEQWGYRNAQTTLLAPTGTIGLLMDCDTTGVEPDFALVKFEAGRRRLLQDRQPVGPARPDRPRLWRRAGPGHHHLRPRHPDARRRAAHQPRHPQGARPERRRHRQDQRLASIGLRAALRLQHLDARRGRPAPDGSLRRELE